MPVRYLKSDNGEDIFGKNNKKLRYVIEENNIILKFAKNWTKEALNVMNDMYEGYNIQSETKQRGRPKQMGERKIERIDKERLRNSAATEDSEDEEKNAFMGYEIGMRVKSNDYPNMGVGSIIKLEIFTSSGETYYNAHIQFKEEIEICQIETLTKARGRKPNKQKALQLKVNVEEVDPEREVDFDIIKIDGEMFLLTKQNEVLSLCGEYKCWVGEISKKMEKCMGDN